MTNTLTRFAPSPNGLLHLGHVYAAQQVWQMAAQLGADVLLRIEDTDAERSSKQSEDIILDSLRWLGLDWDEGPDKGGPYGPYRQSERSEIYAEHVDRLLSDGHAFHCFCSRERLDEVRSAQMSAGETTRYDGHCLSLTDDEVAARLAAGACMCPPLASGACPSLGRSTQPDPCALDLRTPGRRGPWAQR